MGTTPKWLTPTVKQTWVVIPVLLTKFCLGMALGFTSSLLTAIQDPNVPIKMDGDTASWFVSLLGISMQIGFLIASYFVYKYGRRYSLIASLPGILGLILCIFTESVTSLMIIRVLTGISIGGYCIALCVIIGEYTSPQNRGMFLNMSSALLNLGSLLMHVMGNYTSWRALAITVPAPFVVSLIVTCTWPESPSWLAEKKQYDKSRKAFYWLRGKTKESTREIEELIQAQKNKVAVKNTIYESVVAFLRKFKMKNFLKPTFIILLALILMETSGRHMFPAYAAQLLKEIMPNGFDPFLLTIAIDLLLTVGSFVSTCLMKIMRIRVLLFSTGLSAFIVLVLASISLYLFNNGVITKEYSWIPLSLFILYLILSSLGCSSIAFMLMGEIYPLEHRVVGSALGSYMLSYTMTINLKLTPVMVEAMGIDGTFGALALCMAVVLIILYFILPETKNKTMLEIEDFFNHGKFRDGDLIPADDYEAKI